MIQKEKCFNLLQIVNIRMNILIPILVIVSSLVWSLPTKAAGDDLVWRGFLSVGAGQVVNNDNSSTTYSVPYGGNSYWDPFQGCL